LLVLLAANAVYFALAGSTSEAIDAAAWLILLVLFLAETTYEARLARIHWRLALRLMRLLAAVGVFAATVGYVFEDDTLDAVNAGLWILVVILLEVELRWPAAVASSPVLFKTAAGAAFGGLGLLVAIWLSRRMWFDAYDAALWLLAFGLIELHVTRRYTTATQAIDT
jgi:hypothetical protein